MRPQSRYARIKWPRPLQLGTVRAEVHPFCVACSPSNPLGLRLQFTLNEDGSVSAPFRAPDTLQGFPGLLHGGVIASLLDAVMTNCLFTHGYVAVTAELKLRYRKPVLLGADILIRGWLTQAAAPLYVLQAELKQQGCLKATAVAKFMERHE